MPLAAVALLCTLLLVALGSGLLAARLVGPRRWWAPIVPVIAAVIALDVNGHRLGLEVGPTVEVYGFRVALLWDATVALVAALIAARVQCVVHGRLRRRT